MQLSGEFTANIVSVVFLAGYALITLEHRWKLNKAITASALGALLWFVIALHQDREIVGKATARISTDIFSLVVFLLAAMTLVEVLVHYRFFDWIRGKILALRLSDYKQLWVIGCITFFLSAVIDNLTATLVMVAIALRFFRGANLVIAASAIVCAANAGGAWSPVGDVTTIMLWLRGKFGVWDVLAWGFLPSTASFLVSTWMLGRSLEGDSRDIEEERTTLTRSEWAVSVTTLASFALPPVISQVGLEPFFGLLFGLGVVGMLIAVFRAHGTRAAGITVPAELLSGDLGQGKDGSAGHMTHLTSDIEKKLSKIDLASLVFFTGILLAVGALEHLGILERMSHLLFGTQPSLLRYIIGNSSLGILSAIFDNIPLTAAAMDMLKTTDPAIWVLLAIAVGIGGSMLVIGSAAGVVAMGRARELTFSRYMRVATVPALVGYVAAIGVWTVQYAIFR